MFLTLSFLPGETVAGHVRTCTYTPPAAPAISFSYAENLRRKSKAGLSQFVLSQPEEPHQTTDVSTRKQYTTGAGRIAKNKARRENCFLAAHPTQGKLTSAQSGVRFPA